MQLGQDCDQMQRHRHKLFSDHACVYSVVHVPPYYTRIDTKPDTLIYCHHWYICTHRYECICLDIKTHR